jgi:sulfite exporter TauE/SafE/copper chaperone CopZ
MSEGSVTLRARGMHCHGCERIIEMSAAKLAGVRRVKADYPSETVVVDYDPAAASLDAIRAAIEQHGYRVLTRDEPMRSRGAPTKIAALIASLAGLALIIFFDTEWISQGGAPDISQHMSLGLIFTLGLLTGFHCVGMCGGFVLSYTAEDARAGRPPLLSHFFYGAGKTLSYTAIGAGFGWLGAFIAFTPMLRGAAGILAGAFLIVFGLNMLGLFAPLRRFRLGLPAPLRAFVEREASGRQRPFAIGLLNGLMIACGPLQAMYVMAAGTGSALEGAKMLFAFGVGTLPVLWAFGALSSVLSGALTHRLLTASGVIVVVLGAVMINRGLILTGAGYDLGAIVSALRKTAVPSPAPQAPAPQTEAPTPPRPAVQTIEMDVIRSGYSPNRFTLIKGVPVKWIIDGKTLTTCNNRLLVPKLNLEFAVKQGRQTIEFTPRETGVIPFSCWMGMLHGAFNVVDAPPAGTAEPAPSPAASAPARPAEYTIAAGDTLQRVAVKIHGDAKRWREIAAANLGLDPRRLRPGQIIKLPGGPRRLN